MTSPAAVIAIDVGGTNIRAALIAPSGEILVRSKGPTGTDPLSVIFQMADRLAASDSASVVGIGVAVAGVVDRFNGKVLRSPNISSLSGVALSMLLTERCDLPVLIENDANAAALGEKWLGAGREFDSFVLLTLGTGIGCGIVVNGALLPVAAEAGHMSICNDGSACACGNIGCLEHYASATAVVNRAVAAIEREAPSQLRELHQGNFYRITAENIYAAALDGDALARTVLREAGKSLGVGMANLINLLSPQALVLAGGLTGAWNIYGEAAIQEASRRALPELFFETQIIVSPVFDDAGLLGAGRLIWNGIQTEGKTR
ncbi:MAG TPA: ROK family protein [Dissulfurispiraceae bacterium]|nr:ROK family protein [Dissulfurispiraceae bacterium]